MNENNLILFILQICILTNTQSLDEDYVEIINQFIYKQYEEDKESLKIICHNQELLSEFIKNNYQVISLDVISKLISKYNNIDAYLLLLEEIEFETNSKINELALLCINYYDSLIELYNKEIPIRERILQ